MSLTRASALGSLAVFGLVLGASAPAHAWQIESFVTTGCHERITLHAVAAAGYPDGATSPPPSEEERRIIADVPFSFQDDHFRDSWGLALLVGVRNNDLEDHDPTDLATLGSLHDDPHKQDAHCLREETDDGAMGDVIALARCKQFILDELGLALGPAEAVDLDARARVETFLKFRKKTDLNLNNMAFHLGRAMHALEDSYTHILRDDSTDHIRSVLNWIEGNLSGRGYEEARDGFPHIGAVDDCAKTDALTRNRELRATNAATALVMAIARADGGRAGRLARAGTVIDQSFLLDDGCNIDNDYCNAPEIHLSGCGVSDGGALWPAFAGALVLVGGLSLRRRRRGSAAIARAGGVASGVAALLVVALATPLTARADDKPAGPTTGPGGQTPTEDGKVTPTTTQTAEDGTPIPVAPVAVPVIDGAPKSDKVEEKVLDQEDKIIEALPDPTTKTFGLAGSIGGSITRGAAAVSLGLRWNPTPGLGLGLDVEYNPYISFAELDITAGSVNVYVPVIWKLRKFGNWELRSTFGAGTSILLFDLVQADKYSIGLFANWNPLGVAFSFGANWKLVVKPGDISVPIPELIGFPFYYPEYKFTVGFEWYP